MDVHSICARQSPISTELLAAKSVVVSSAHGAVLSLEHDMRPLRYCYQKSNLDLMHMLLAAAYIALVAYSLMRCPAVRYSNASSTVLLKVTHSWIAKGLGRQHAPDADLTAAVTYIAAVAYTAK